MPRLLLACVAVICGCSADPGPREDPEIPESFYCEPVRTWYPDWREWEQEVIALVNERRAEGAACGGLEYPPVAPLEIDERLICAARKHSVDMQHHAFVAHQSPDGSTPPERIRRAGFPPSTCGENIAVIGRPLVRLPAPAEDALEYVAFRSHPSPARAVDLWMESRPHCRNIMNEDFTETGVGFVLSVEGAPILTQAFADSVY